MLQSPRRVLARAALGAAAALVVSVAVAGQAGASPPSFLGGLPQQRVVASTIPSSPTPLPGDGDVNPYGVALVPSSLGKLVEGDILVSNFNNAANQQGTGRTIEEISPSGQRTTFARVPELQGGTGLTTALAVLPRGFVVVGSLPTGNGKSANATAGALIILNADGQVVQTISGGDINGPWDMTAVSFGDFSLLFVSNVLNGTVAAGGHVVHMGTVVRLLLEVGPSGPRVVNNTVIASGFAEQTNPAALVLGPTGLGLGRDGTLYVANTVGSTIQAIPDAVFRQTSAGTGMKVTRPGNGLWAPLGLAIAPNGDILTVNGGNGRIVETAPDGTRVASRLLDSTGSPPGNGALFGLAVSSPFPGMRDEGDSHAALYFVDDVTNQLDVLLPQSER